MLSLPGVISSEIHSPWSSLRAKCVGRGSGHGKGLLGLQVVSQCQLSTSRDGQVDGWRLGRDLGFCQRVGLGLGHGGAFARLWRPKRREFKPA